MKENRLDIREWTEEEIRLSEEDLFLFQKAGDFIKAGLDIEEAELEKSFSEIYNLTAGIVAEKIAKSGKNREIESFVKDNFIPAIDLLESETEIEGTGVDLAVGKWVNDWQEKKEDSGKKEISDFVTDSSNSHKEGFRPAMPVRKILQRRYLPYVMLAAAAITGAVLITDVLLKSSDTGRVFTRYYEPMEVVSPATRGTGTGKEQAFDKALSSYVSRKYSEASAAFSEIAVKDTSNLKAKFFTGLSNIAIGKYEEAVSILRGINGRHFEFSSESSWYLGLALLKSGNKGEAIKYFEELEKSGGFYSPRSAAILRRIK